MFYILMVIGQSSGEPKLGISLPPGHLGFSKTPVH